MSENTVINSVKFSVVSGEDRLKDILDTLKQAQEEATATKPRSIMVLFQDEYDGMYVYRYLSSGLKSSEKVSLLEFVKQHVLRGD